MSIMEQSDQLVEKSSAFLQPNVSLTYLTQSTRSSRRTKESKSNFSRLVR
jgi:hypothetical protein